MTEYNDFIPTEILKKQMRSKVKRVSKPKKRQLLTSEERSAAIKRGWEKRRENPEPKYHPVVSNQVTLPNGKKI